MTPVPFVRFVEHVVGVQLTPGQRVLCGVAFDGIDPADLAGTDRDLARRLFGDVDAVPPEAREVVVAILGARAGKSYLLVALYSLWRALTANVSALAPGELAIALICAPDLRLGRQALRFALGAAESCSDIAPLIVGRSSDALELQRPDGRRVAIECLPATARGTAVRGRSLVSAALDEACFFRDADFKVNDADVFEAVAPRVIVGGQVVIASTPWAQVGLSYELFAANHGRPRTAIAAHAPTLLLRDDARTRRQIDRETERDPDNARREFGAEFMVGDTEQWFDPHSIELSTDAERPPVVPPIRGAWRSAGGDFGFTADSSALVIVQYTGDLYHVSLIDELRPQKDQPLVPSEVARHFSELCHSYDIADLIADSWAREPMREHLQNWNMWLRPAPEGQLGKLEVYTWAKTLLSQGLVRLPKNSRLTAQLNSIQGRRTSGGAVSITAPRKGGAHGDIVSALVLALWGVSGRRRSAGRAINRAFDHI